MASSHSYGRPPGAPDDRQLVGMLDIPGGMKITTISGGSLVYTDAATGDSQDTLTVNSVDILGAAVTWATDDDTFGHLITRQINSYSATSGYWATLDAANDKIFIWPRTGGTAAITHTVSGVDTGYTPVYENMNTGQAYVAAVRKPSWNYGVDFFPDTKMYECSFDWAYLGHASNQSSIANCKGIELIVRPEDQAVYFYIGSEGLIYCASAVETVIAVKGVVEGDIPMFCQAAAATNCAFRFRVW
jgi:hypothetical protein